MTVEIISMEYTGQPLYHQLIARLQRAMAKNHLSQIWLAHRSGVPQGNISKILAGERPGTLLTTWDKLLAAAEN